MVGFLKSRNARADRADLTVMGEVPLGFQCPACGAVDSLSFGRYVNRVGQYDIIRTCRNEPRWGQPCGFIVKETYDEPNMVWVSPNGKWTIIDPAVEMRSNPRTHWSRTTVNSVGACDGSTTYWSTIYEDGRIVHDSTWSVPGYVLRQVERVLRAKGYTDWSTEPWVQEYEARWYS